MLLLSVGKTPDINSHINENKITIFGQNRCGEDMNSPLTELYTNVSPDDHTRQACPRWG